MAQCVIALLAPLLPDVYGHLISWDARQLAFARFDFNHAAEPQAPLARAPFVSVLQLLPSDVVIDLRAEDEMPRLDWPCVRRICPDLVAEHLSGFAKETRLVFCCRSGIRAARAAQHAADQGFTHLALMAVAPVSSG